MDRGNVQQLMTLRTDKNN